MENMAGDVGTYSVLKLLFSLSFVIGMIFLTTYLYKKFSNTNIGKLGSKGTFLKVLTTLPIGTKKYLSVIKAGDKFLLIGITDNSVNLITELENVEIEESSSKNNFVGILRKAKQRMEKTNE